MKGAPTIGIAQGGRFESILQNFDFSQKFTPTRIIARETDVVKTVVGKIPSAMTRRAIGLGVENIKPAFGRRRDRIFLCL